MADVKSADPEDDVFGNVGSVVGDALEVTRGENELHAGAHQLGLLSHVLEQLLENAVAVLTHDIVAFENLRGHLEVPENQGAKTLRSEEHTSELQSPDHLVCRLLLE